MPPRRWSRRTRRSAVVLAVVLVVAFAVLAGYVVTSRPGPVDQVAQRTPTAQGPQPAASGSTEPQPSAGQSLGASARPATPTSSADGRPLTGKVVAIDPGHNIGNARHLAQVNRKVFVGNGYKSCNTTGTETDAGYPESRFTMAVADVLKADLEALGATVRLTRTSEDPDAYGPCVDQRGRFGGQVHADAEVSIHGDGEPANRRGFQVIRPGAVRGMPEAVRTQSQALQKQLVAALLRDGEPAFLKGGFVTRSDLGTLNLSTVPIVLVELGNMRNATDAAIMTSAAGQAGFARALAAGLVGYLG